MPNGICGISPAINAALSGIRGSVERFNVASSQVSRAAAETAGETTSAGPDTASFSGAALTKVKAAPEPQATLEEALIEQSVARHDLAANVQVIKTADQMMKSLIDILRPR